MRISCAILFAVSIFLLPVEASAQTVSTLEVNINPKTLKLGQCGNKFTLSVTAKDSLGNPIPDLQNSDRWTFSVGQKSTCENGGELKKSLALAGGTGNYKLEFSGTEMVRAGLNVDCETRDINEALWVCAQFDNDSGTTNAVKNSVKVQVTTTVPNAPVLTKVSPGDKKLHLSFQPNDEGSPSQWQVCFREVAGTGEGALEEGEDTFEPFADGGTDDGTAGTDDGMAGAGGGTAGTGGGTAGTDDGTAGTGGGTAGTGGTDEGGAGTGEGGTGEGGTGEGGTGEGGTGGTGGTVSTSDICDRGSKSRKVSGSERSFTLENLRNRVTYEVAVRAFDTESNPSSPSNLMEGTPVPTVGFWDLYKEAGGEDEGGCSATGGSMWLGLVAAGIFFASRRSGRR